MPITISDTTPRDSYTVGGTPQTAFTVNFEFFADADLKVYVDSTLKTLTTHYTVSGAGTSGGGTVTMGTGVSNATVTITRDMAISRTTDFPVSGAFQIDTLNDELDKQVAMMQQNERDIARTFKSEPFDTVNDFTLPVQADRKGKLFGFDSTHGNPEAVTGRVNTVTVSNVATSSGSPGTATASFTESTGALALGIPVGQTGMMGGVSMQYSTTTTDSDPGAGFIRLNNTSLNSATIMYVDDSDGTTDITAWVQSWDDADGSNRGIITIAGNPNPASPLVTYKVTGAVTDASGYTKIPVVYLAGSTSISNNAEISLAFSPAGSSGVPPGLGLKYSTTTTDSDPGAGYIRFNNGTLASATACYIDDADLAGADISGLVQSWDDSTTTALRGTITLVKETNTAVWAQWNITGAATNASGYTKQALTYVAGTGSFSNDDLVRLSFSRTGNLGSTGSQGIQGIQGVKGDAPGVLMTYETATADSDQGAGKVWLNHGTASSATVLYMDDVEAGGASINSMVDSWDDSTTTALRGTISIYKNSAPANFHIYNVTGAVTSASTYSKVAVTHVVSAGTISDGDAVSVQFVRTGNAGGGMTSFTMSDGSTTQTVENGETQTFAAGEALDVAVSATNTVTYSAEDASATNKGVAELATSAETTTGTDSGRVVTPAGLHGGIAGLSDATITASDKVAFVDVGSSNALKTDTVQGILDLAGGADFGAVDENIIPDGDATRNIGSAAAEFNKVFMRYPVLWERVFSVVMVRLFNNAGTFELAVAEHSWDIGAGSTNLGPAMAASHTGNYTAPMLDSSTGFGGKPAGILDASTSMIRLNTHDMGSGNNIIGQVFPGRARMPTAISEDGIYATFGCHSRNIGGTTEFQGELLTYYGDNALETNGTNYAHSNYVDWVLVFYGQDS